jgi:Tfp pilus assembly protein PilO
MSLWRRVYDERRAIMLPLVVLLALDLAMLALGVFPLSRLVASLDAEAQNAGTNLLRARVVEKQARDAVASRTRADQELKRFYVDILPASPTSSRRVMAVLQGAAKDAGLEFKRSQYDENPLEDSRLVRMTGTINLVGDYPSIRKFLYNVETASEFVIVERVRLSQASDLRSANSGRLDITLDVATYYAADAVPVSR